MITFKFMRRRTGDSEVWNILVPAANSDDLERRFGSSVRVDAYEDAFYEVGDLFVVHSRSSSEFILACHFDLAEDERNKLLREITLLVGREVFRLGSEFEARWVLHDEVTSFTTDRAASGDHE
jgi:hypothetical protein